MASAPSGEIVDAVTTYVTLMLDASFEPRRMASPESVETKATSGNLTARLKSFG